MFVTEIEEEFNKIEMLNTFIFTVLTEIFWKKE